MEDLIPQFDKYDTFYKEEQEGKIVCHHGKNWGEYAVSLWARHRINISWVNHAIQIDNLTNLTWATPKNQVLRTT